MSTRDSADKKPFGPAGQPKRILGSKPGSPEKARNPRPRPAPAAAEKTGCGKRLACDNCRERKVRCNREQPVCGRCARLGHNCKYTAPAQQKPSKTDVSRLLMTLQSRLAQTEARLAINLPLPDLDQAMSFEPVPNAVEVPSLEATDTQQQSEPLDLGYFDDMVFDEQILQSDDW